MCSILGSEYGIILLNEVFPVTPVTRAKAANSETSTQQTAQLSIQEAEPSTWQIQENKQDT